MYELDRLRAEDAPVFERMLDRALNSEEIRAALHGAGGTPHAEQLRTQARGAREAIVSAAAVEYRAYLQLRASTARSRPAQQSAETTARAGAGLLPALGVLVPGLSATAAAVFLLFGCGLRAVGMGSRLADELIFAGLTAGAIAAAATLIGLVWMLVTAARNRAAADAGTPGDMDSAATRAREAWQQALLERGVTPFLLGLLDDTGPAGSDGPAELADSPSGGNQTQHLGPGFSTPDFTGPDFGSPGFTGPDLPGSG
ncbi:hypothetical protein ADL29_23540 [Streptomyces chattanoogensis]|uniref:Transmembrane protein n=2 Tax=Streptomyces chattanoogensis TaxID=66876 RepID=A0A0N0GY46_9ACTN|nr:hypothetical protein ADL29_23540 [Streptomyces chattanoogensis]